MDKALFIGGGGLGGGTLGSHDVLHSSKLTLQWIMDQLKMIFLQDVVFFFHCHVYHRVCIFQRSPCILGYLKT